MYYTVYYINILMTTLLNIFRRFPTTFRRFPKIFPNLSEGQTNVSKYSPNILRRLPKISEDCRRLPKIAEEEPIMFRSYSKTIQIHQSAYHDQTNTPVRGRVVGLNCQRSWYADWFESTRIPQMPLVEFFAPVMLRKLVLQLQLFSRNFGRIELSFGWGMDTYLVDREPVFSR